MEEILEATPAGLLEEVKEVVEGVLTLPGLGEELDFLTEQLTAIQNTVSALVIFDFLLLIAVLFLLFKHFKK